jgi:hypothetical protein
MQRSRALALVGLLTLGLVACYTLQPGGGSEPPPTAAGNPPVSVENSPTAPAEAATHPAPPATSESGTAPEATATEPQPEPEVTAAAPQGRTADNPLPPSETVRLIFLHHSTGGNWLADPGGNELGGGLGQALMDNHYFVSATNYGWGPDAIGDYTDIGQWWDWFRGPNRDTYLEAMYSESGQNFGDFGEWPRLAGDPGGENQVIVIKSCFPNSYLGGSPGDEPAVGDNPIHSAGAGDDTVYTVGNARGLYNDLLEYFATRPDKLFIIVTAPPQAEFETDAAHAANARALNEWLINDWLAGYPLDNVAVFDFYNVLTSNAGDADHNDLGAESGNHHRWWNGAVQHVHSEDRNDSAYPSGDSHPARAGNEKATAEFVELLNVYYHRWADSAP